MFGQIFDLMGSLGVMDESDGTLCCFFFLQEVSIASQKKFIVCLKVVSIYKRS